MKKAEAEAAVVDLAQLPARLQLSEAPPYYSVTYAVDFVVGVDLQLLLGDFHSWTPPAVVVALDLRNFVMISMLTRRKWITNIRGFRGVRKENARAQVVGYTKLSPSAGSPYGEEGLVKRRNLQEEPISLGGGNTGA
jgi:hypothetical protein